MTDVVASSRSVNLALAKTESGVQNRKRNMRSQLRAEPGNMHWQQECLLKDLLDAHDEAMRDIRPQKPGLPAMKGREQMRSFRQALKDEGFAVPMTKLWRRLELARHTTSYKLSQAPESINARLADPVSK
ncbi:hypothetical protein [Stenotrophomonas sp.]|uniref:hypothetical protein n=1 Tax=Stenotrophomonas sp. TaxID=69392 RepID=UPI0028AD032C|nr:hypothetical protein [Stenotrophomonas sp.]